MRRPTLTPALTGLRLHPRQCLRDPPKQILDIMPHFCARLDEHQIMCLGLVLTLLGRDFSLVVKIGLVTHQHDNDVVTALASDVVDPFSSILE